MSKKSYLLSRIYIILSIFSFSDAFSQSIKNDQCNGIFNGNSLLIKIVDAYEDGHKKQTKGEVIFGCGTAAKQYHEEMRCETAKSILQKYPFILTELKVVDNKDEQLNILWIDGKNKAEDLEPWKNSEQNKNHSTVVISSKTDRNKENLQLEINTSKLHKVKKYKLFFTNEWIWKEI